MGRLKPKKGRDFFPDSTKKNKKPKPTNKISVHFAKRDFVCKCGHCDQAIKISLGLIGGLELLRMLLGKRITIVRGYMCPDAVEKQGSLRRNYYVMGIAADISVDGMSPSEVFQRVIEIPEFKGIGLNLDAGYVHVDTRKVAQPVLWVEQNKQVIDITDDNRHRYLPPQPERVSDPFVDGSATLSEHDHEL